MTTHYLKIALRNMRRFKLQTIVCVTGLAVGMTCFTLGTLWLRYIESFEDFVPDGDNIYLVMSGEGKMMYSDELGFSHNDRGVVYFAPEKLRTKIQQSSLTVESYLSDW